jgi:hypothetical protein
MTVKLDGDDQGIAAGQYAVLYDDAGVCLGSAVIQCALPGSVKQAADLRHRVELSPDSSGTRTM